MGFLNLKKIILVFCIQHLAVTSVFSKSLKELPDFVSRTMDKLRTVGTQVDSCNDVTKSSSAKSSQSELFGSSVPLQWELQSNFYSAKPESIVKGEKYSAKLKNSGKAIATNISARGNTRFGCEVKMLKIDPVKKDATIFSNVHTPIKLVSHCSDKDSLANDKVIEEEFIYKGLQALGIPTFKTRAGNIEYKDENGVLKSKGSFFLLENKKDLQERIGGKIFDEDFVPEPKDIQLESFIKTKLINQLFLLGDTNLARNQLKLKNAQGKFEMIPFDFDSSLLVINSGRDMSVVYKDGFKNDQSEVSSIRNGAIFEGPKISEVGKKEWEMAFKKVSSELMEKKDNLVKSLSNSAVKNKQLYESRFENFFNALKSNVQN